MKLDLDQFVPDHDTSDDSAPISGLAASDTKDDVVPSSLRRVSTTSTSVASVVSSLSSSTKSSSVEGQADSERGDEAWTSDHLSEWFDESFGEFEEIGGSTREQSCVSFDDIAVDRPAATGECVALLRCDAFSECGAAEDDVSSTATGLGNGGDGGGGDIGQGPRDGVEEEGEEERGGEDLYDMGLGLSPFWVTGSDPPPVALVVKSIGNATVKNTTKTPFRTSRRRTSTTQESHAELAWCGTPTSSMAQALDTLNTSTVDYEYQENCKPYAQARSISEKQISRCTVGQTEKKQAPSIRSVDAFAVYAAGIGASGRDGNISGGGFEIGSRPQTLVNASILEPEDVAAEDAWLSDTLLEEPFDNAEPKEHRIGEEILDCPLYCI